jgi:ribonuclease P protein component
MHCFGTAGTGTLKKRERISSSGDIRALFKNGKKAGVPGAKLFFLKNSLKTEDAGGFAAAEGCARFAVTFPRGYGCAVERNRSKRLCREAFRLQKADIARGYDLLFLLYRRDDESFDLRCKQVRSLCKKAGLIHG